MHPRLMGVDVERHAVDASAQHRVAQFLHGPEIGVPFAAAAVSVRRGEGFGHDDRLAVHVGRAGAELGPVGARNGIAHPALAHRDVGLAAGRHVVELTHVVRLAGELLAGPMTEFPHVSEVVLVHQADGRMAEVPQEPLRFPHAVHNPPGEDWQIGTQIVLLPLGKLLRQPGRPVLAPFS